MEALIAKADAIPSRKRKRPDSKAKATSDRTYQSLVKQTSLPKSLRPTKSIDGLPAHDHIANKKLRRQLVRTAETAAQSKMLREDAELLLTGEAGGVAVEGEMERTWRVGQAEIAEGAGQEAARGRREWKLDGGPYRSRYTRNGRHLAIAGRNGHVATFDWQTGQLHSELQLQETCRDITFLHDQSHYAVAQKKYVYIYDRDGVELHCLKAHIEPTRLEFLPYHWLLVSIGNPGYLKYQDTSTGQLVVEHRTKLGACSTMAQNTHNAVIHLGHQNGCVTLWTPNLPHPAVQLLAQLGPVASLSIDPSTGGRYMATAGQDSTVKIWDCRNWKGAIREWSARGGPAELEWSARGALAVASGGTVNIYTKPSIHTPLPAKAQPPLYLTHPITTRPLTSVRFAPFQDVLTIGHNAGLSSILVPGAGEPNFDSAEADPFENKKTRREREVRGLLDKIQPDMIALDADFVGSLAPESKLTTAVTATLAEGKGKTVNGKSMPDVPFARLSRMERLRISGKADTTEDTSDWEDEADGENDEEKKKQRKEDREKKKMRGKGKSLARYLRKQRKNVIDPTAVAIRQKLEKQEAEKARAELAAAGQVTNEKPSALDRFKRSR